MPQTSDTPDTNKALFLQFVLMLSSSTMQQLGKLMNPLTGKTEINLEAAQSTIDLLIMLDAKTRGNLDREEERFLKNTLATLQMNYVETAQSAPAKPEAAPPAPPMKRRGRDAAALPFPAGLEILVEGRMAGRRIR